MRDQSTMQGRTGIYLDNFMKLQYYAAASNLFSRYEINLSTIRYNVDTLHCFKSFIFPLKRTVFFNRRVNKYTLWKAQESIIYYLSLFVDISLECFSSRFQFYKYIAIKKLFTFVGGARHLLTNTRLKP